MEKIFMRMDGTCWNEDGAPAPPPKPYTLEDSIRFRIDMHVYPTREWMRIAEECILERWEEYVYAPHSTVWIFYVTRNQGVFPSPETKWLHYEYMPANQENMEWIIRGERERIRQILETPPRNLSP